MIQEGIKNWTHHNFVIHEFSELASTNSHAFALAETQKILDREVILAKSQTGGKGRQNRSWISPAGNLYFSLVLRPDISAEKIPQISFVGIIALRNCLTQIFSDKKTAPTITIKWPNDLLLDEKKVAGLLLESKISQQKPEFLVLGIGLNLESNPSDTIFPAGNLRNFDVTISPENFLKIFLEKFEKTYQNWLDFGFKQLRQSWLQSAYRLNQKISVRSAESPSDFIEGIFENLDEEGNLLLRRGEEIVKISAADIF